MKPVFKKDGQQIRDNEKQSHETNTKHRLKEVSS